MNPQCKEVISGEGLGLCALFASPPGQLVDCCVKQVAGLDGPLMGSSKALLVFLLSFRMFAATSSFDLCL